MAIQERRRNRRATVQLFVSQISGGKLFSPLMADISEQGLLLESPSGLEMPRHHAPVVELMLPGVPEIIYARCRVLRQSEHGFFTKRALEFVDISAAQRQLVRRYIRSACGLC